VLFAFSFSFHDDNTKNKKRSHSYAYFVIVKFCFSAPLNFTVKKREREKKRRDRKDLGNIETRDLQVNNKISLTVRSQLINSLLGVKFDGESFGNKIKLFRSDLGSLLPTILLLAIR
jgi:hypothetical protein